MDTRQRYIDPEETIRVALEELQCRIWTAIPGIVQSYNPVAGTVEVQIAIQGVRALYDGSAKYVDITQLVDVPVKYSRGGGVTLTFPIAAGDEALIVFACRCIDSWWQNGGTQNVPMNASLMHDIGDGFALIGPFSQKTILDSISTTTAQLRSNDGSTAISLDPAGQIVSVVAPGGMHITAPTVLITGAVTVSESIEAQTTITAQGIMSSPTDVQTGTISLANHVHGGVVSGGSDTTGPIG